MIRHAPPHRTIERDRLGTPQGEPTPEQLADDGRSDGIPVVTIAELNAAREAHERRLTELAGGPLRRPGGNRTGKPILWVEAGKKFKSIREAEIGLGTQRVPIYRIIRGEKLRAGVTLKWAG